MSLSITTSSQHISTSTIVPSHNSSEITPDNKMFPDDSSLISSHDINHLIASLFHSMKISHDKQYTHILSHDDIRSYHILLLHYIQCHHIHIDDMTHSLLVYGSDEESLYTWGEMSTKRDVWLNQYRHTEQPPPQLQQHQHQEQKPPHHSESIQLDTILVKPVTPKTIPIPRTTPTSVSTFDTMKGTIKKYISKFAGQHHPTPPMMPWWDQFWAFLGSFLGILVPAFLNFEILADYANKPELAFLIASFGATAVLIFSAIGSDLAQPRSLIGGHMLSALVGVTVRRIIPTEYTFIACALAVAISIAVMNLTKTLHPPGGATALIAVIPNKVIQDLGFLYVLLPVGSGAFMMLLIALIANNISRPRTWPRYWI